MLTHCLRTSNRELKLPETVAIISFFLLFPGFLFYHQFLAMGLIPRFAAGFFGYVSVGTLAAFLLLLPWTTDWLKKTTRNRYVQWVLLFLIFTSVWTLAHYVVLEGDYITTASVQSLETVIIHQFHHHPGFSGLFLHQFRCRLVLCPPNLWRNGRCCQLPGIWP